MHVIEAVQLQTSHPDWNKLPRTNGRDSVFEAQKLAKSFVGRTHSWTLVRSFLPKERTVIAERTTPSAKRFRSCGQVPAQDSTGAGTDGNVLR